MCPQTLVITHLVISSDKWCLPGNGTSTWHRSSHIRELYWRSQATGPESQSKSLFYQIACKLIVFKFHCIEELYWRSQATGPESQSKSLFYQIAQKCKFIVFKFHCIEEMAIIIHLQNLLFSAARCAYHNWQLLWEQGQANILWGIQTTNVWSQICVDNYR